jgi:hypothetical protein
MAHTSHPHPAVRERWIARTAQILGAVLVGATGAIHLYLYDDYFSAVPTIGRLFLANFIAGVILGVLLLLRRGWIWPVWGRATALQRSSPSFGASSGASSIITNRFTEPGRAEPRRWRSPAYLPASWPPS